MASLGPDTNVIMFPQPDKAAIIGEAVAGDSAKVRKELEDLIGMVNKSTFDIAFLLYKVKSGKYYAAYGFDTMKDFIKSLDIKERKAQYLLRIVEIMEQCGQKREDYEPLGIAKLREITSLDPNGSWLHPTDKKLIPLKDFIISFVAEGSSMTLEQVKQHVRTLKGLVGENELIFINLCMKKSVRDAAWKPAIEKAKMNIGSVGRDPETGDAIMASDGRAAEVIAIEYLNNPANDPIPPEYEEAK